MKRFANFISFINIIFLLFFNNSIYEFSSSDSKIDQTKSVIERLISYVKDISSASLRRSVTLKSNLGTPSRLHLLLTVRIGCFWIWSKKKTSKTEAGFNAVLLSLLPHCVCFSFLKCKFFKYRSACKAMKYVTKKSFFEHEGT